MTLSKMIVERRDTPEGVTLCFCLREIDDVQVLVRLFERLSVGAVQEIELKNEKDFELRGLEDFVLRLTERDKGESSDIRLFGESRQVCEWEKTKEGWMDTAGLTQGLIGGNKGFFQHLTGYSKRDLVDVIAEFE